MGKFIRGKCVLGAILAIVAGCALPDKFGLNFLQTTNTGEPMMVAGSLESVSETTQAGLKRLGIKVMQTSEGADIRLAATTPAGEHFSVILTRAKTEQGERTRIRFEGGTNAHQEMVGTILSARQGSERR
jgi:hypothetical protein